MAAEASVAYYVSLDEAYAYNPTFPDQRVELDPVLLGDFMRIADNDPASHDYFDMVTETLRRMYSDKYMS